MSKIYVQRFPVVLQSSACFLSTASPSGSALCAGYSRLIGIVYAGCAMDSPSGLRIEESSDSGVNWDAASNFGVAASAGSSFSHEIAGNAVRLVFHSACNINAFRTLWQLRPV